MSEIARALIPLVEPIGLVWLALMVLAALLWWKRQRVFAISAAGIAAFIFLIGATHLPDVLLESLEHPYIGVKLDALPQADAVVMLGGCLDPAPNEIAGLHPTKAADRIVAALELIRLGKAPVLICGGAGAMRNGEMQIEADLLKRALIERRVPVPEIISLGHCADTRDEAVRTRAILQQRGWRRVLLVTSANHLPRAVATFRGAGVEITAAPCNFQARPRRGLGPIRSAIPGYVGFEQMAAWTHEQIGWLEYRRRGWVAAP